MIYICKPKKVAIYLNTARKTAAQIRAETGCTALINGGLFNMSAFRTTGNVKVNGVEISREWDAFQGYYWNDGEPLSFGWSDMRATDNFIGCVTLVEGGGKVEKMFYPADMGGARPRTAFGLFPDGRVWLYATTVNTTPEALQQTAFDAGVESAVMMDGGGSTQAISPTGVVASTRIVANYICVWAEDDTPKDTTAELNIIETDWQWSGSMDKRTATNRLVLHHAAVKEASALAIHNGHIGNGWSGIGYHYYVRKDGSIYRGRPENVVGIHASTVNIDSLGICFEGNFENEEMSEAQRKAGTALVKDILSRYGNLKVIRHKDVNATACPGRNFPFEEIAGRKADSKPETKPTTQEANKVTIALDILRNGATGEQVRALQILLNGRGFACGNADGIWGAKTQNAVIAFQRSRGLTVDGIVGTNTWTALMG